MTIEGRRPRLVLVGCWLVAALFGCGFWGLYAEPDLTRFGLMGWALALGLWLVAGIALASLARPASNVHERAADDIRRIKEGMEQSLRGSKISLWEFDMSEGQSFENSRATLVNVWESLGYHPSEGPSDSLAAFAQAIPPDDLEKVLEAVRDCLEGSSDVFQIENRVRHKDGSLRWHLSRGIVVRDSAGRPIRFNGSGVDITDLKRAEEAHREAEIAIRESEDRFRSTFENAGAGIALCDVEGHFLRVNQTFSEITGYSEAELAGQSYRAITHPDDRESHKQQFQELLRGEIPNFSVEKRYVRKDGATVWVALSASVQRDMEQRPLRTIAVIQDISERRRLEAEVRRAKDRLDIAVHGSNLTIWEFDMPDGRIENSSVCFINVWEPLGFDPAEMPTDFSAAFALALHPDDQERVGRELGAALSGNGSDFESEYRVRPKSGADRWTLARGSILRDDTGRPIRFTGSSVDVTQLRHAKDAAEAANRAKDEFLANVSHEIRTPMNAILGMTELVLDTSLTEDQRLSLKTAKSAADNLLELINDLLDFSKIEAGRFALEAEAFSLRAVLGDTLRALTLRAHRKGLELASRVQPDVPDAVVGDPVRLRQVVLNLVGNAVKFTEQGEVVIHVSVAAMRATQSKVLLAFAVRDTGIGIPKDKQEAIFCAFEQEDSSTTRKYGGTGLGLTISAQIAKLMNGAIRVESDRGRGSVFTFTAEFVVNSKAPAPTTYETQLSLERVRSLGVHAAAASAGPLDILIAEDNEYNAQFMATLLTRRGHRVRRAANGNQALTLANTETFDLLFLDIHMPEKDGFEVIQAIREREIATGRRLRVIALTARSRQQDRERCLAAGLDDFLVKPVRVSDLWAVLDQGERHPAAAESTASTRGLLSPDALLAACGADPEILSAICESFRTHLPLQVTRLFEAFQAGDSQRLFDTAHQLGSMLAAFSSEAALAVSRVEDLAEAERLDECGPLIAQVEALAPRLLQQVARVSIETLQATPPVDRD